MSVRVVIADDVEDLRLVYRLQFRNDLRFDVVGEASDGQETLDVVHDVRPDLLLLDIEMPGPNGLEILDELRDEDHAPVTIVLSGVSAYADGEQALERGADAFMRKGDVSERFTERVHAAYEQAATGRGWSLPPTPPDEDERLVALRACHAVGASIPALDRVASMAAAVCEMPIGLVSLVEETEQWFVGRSGLDVEGTGRDESFCAHAIVHPAELLVVPDAMDDERFRANPLVVGPPYIRFYAGAPLVDGDGRALGTLCVIGQEPGELDQGRRDFLASLAVHTVELLVARRSDDGAGSPAEVTSLRTPEQRSEYQAIVQHKMKTPLTVIQGWLRLFARSGDFDTELGTEGLAAMQRAADDLSQRIDGMIEQTQSELVGSSLVLGDCTVADVLNEHFVSTPLPSDDHELVVDLHDPGPVRADPKGLRHIIGHLVENAVKYTPSGEIRIAVDRVGEEVVVSVEDDGPGLPSGVDVFAPFERGPARHLSAGSGMGLHIVRTFTESFGGTVDSVPSEGGGARFEVRLPARG